MSKEEWWASESFWRKNAIWITAGSFVVLIFLTFDTISQITAGGTRVPGYTVINHRITYEFNEDRNMLVPVIGVEEPLFGQKLTEEEAQALVTRGNLNCAFAYDPGVGQRGGLVMLQLSLSEAGETINLLHQVHVVNAP